MSTEIDTKNPTESVNYGPRPGTEAGVARLPRRMRGVLALDDLEEQARRHLPRPIFGYVSGASGTSSSLRDNRNVFGEYGFRPRTRRLASPAAQARGPCLAIRRASALPAIGTIERASNSGRQLWPEELEADNPGKPLQRISRLR